MGRDFGKAGGIAVAVFAVIFGVLLYWLFAASLYWMSENRPYLLGNGLINRDRAARRMGRHAAAKGWEPVGSRERAWPWTALQLRGTIRVGRAWAFEADGFQVAAGELVWTGNAFAGATDSRADKGVFVVIYLRAEAPPMAMRRPYLTVGDSTRLASSALRVSFLSGEIPPWTVRGKTLFTIETISGWTRPDQIEDCVRRALLVTELLELRAKDGADGLRGTAEAS